MGLFVIKSDSDSAPHLEREPGIDTSALAKENSPQIGVAGKNCLSHLGPISYLRAFNMTSFTPYQCQSGTTQDHEQTRSISTSRMGDTLRGRGHQLRSEHLQHKRCGEAQFPE
ncbi:hypothetical protein J6590_068764 [Homalodisca vitripennis]|nr:hypothetical protein J6590_068764 [Homalodisca vitripennis]